jgi:flagellar biosynthesis protein FlhF
MHLKRYRRENVKQALQAVRDELGPNALVLSTRTVVATGVRGLLGKQDVEVTAAAERHEVTAERHAEPGQAFGVSGPYSVGQVGHERFDGDDALLQPRRGLTGRRPVPPAAAGRRPRAERAATEIAARLQASGLDIDLARAIADSHPVNRRRSAGLESLRETVAKELARLATADESFAPVEVFVGPPGVGKTTTIAKIAAQERARQGQRVGLLAADAFRVGAIEQLRLYADILGAPFLAARSVDEFARALGDFKRPFLVDTAGRSPKDDVAKDMFRVLSGRSGVRTHLLIPATASPAAARKLFERFADARPSRVLLTRLDEVDSIGPLVSVLRDSGLPLSYFGTGQNVPADLQRVTAPVLADWIMGEMTGAAA